MRRKRLKRTVQRVARTRLTALKANSTKPMLDGSWLLPIDVMLVSPAAIVTVPKGAELATLVEALAAKTEARVE